MLFCSLHQENSSHTANDRCFTITRLQLRINCVSLIDKTGSWCFSLLRLGNFCFHVWTERGCVGWSAVPHAACLQHIMPQSRRRVAVICRTVKVLRRLRKCREPLRIGAHAQNNSFSFWRNVILWEKIWPVAIPGRGNLFIDPEKYFHRIPSCQA